MITPFFDGVLVVQCFFSVCFVNNCLCFDYFLLSYDVFNLFSN